MKLTAFIDPYRLKEFLIFAITAASVLVVALLIGMIVHKLYIEFQTKRMERFRKEYVLAISSQLIESDIEIGTPKGRMQREALGDVMIDMLASIAGDMEAKVKKLALDLGMSEHYVLNVRVAGQPVDLCRETGISEVTGNEGFLPSSSLRGRGRSRDACQGSACP